MTCRFSTNGLSLESSRSFCKFISDYLYDILRTRVKVTLERTDTETLFNVLGRLPPNMCDSLTLEFSELILFDGRYYIGKGPKDEYIAQNLGLNLSFFNWYIFATEDIVLPRNEDQYKELFYIYGIRPSVMDYIEFISGKFVFRGQTGIVYKKNSERKDKENDKFMIEDETDRYQSWIRTL